jgi:putative pyruvate formate lyase activating enzyme
MHRQVGHLPDDQALHHARRGLILRHLVMPGGLAGTSRVMRLLAEDLGEALWLSLMAQYVPEPLTYTAGGAAAVTRFPELGRTITAAEYEEALDAARLAGLTRLFTQDLATSPTTGLPDFDRAEPFLWDA